MRGKLFLSLGLCLGLMLYLDAKKPKCSLHDEMKKVENSPSEIKYFQDMCEELKSTDKFLDGMSKTKQQKIELFGGVNSIKIDLHAAKNKLSWKEARDVSYCTLHWIRKPVLERNEAINKVDYPEGSKKPNSISVTNLFSYLNKKGPFLDRKNSEMPKDNMIIPFLDNVDKKFYCCYKLLGKRMKNNQKVFGDNKEMIMQKLTEDDNAKITQKTFETAPNVDIAEQAYLKRECDGVDLSWLD